MKLKRIFACALASVFTAAIIIPHPASAADSAKNIDESQEMICNEANEELKKSDDESVNADEQNEESPSDPSDEETSATDESTSDDDESTSDDDESTSDDDESLEPNKRIKRLKTKNAILKEKNKRLKIRSDNLKLIKECCREAVIGALTFLVSEVLIKSSFGSHIVNGIFGQYFSDVNSNVHKLSAVTTLITLLCI